MYEPLLSGSSTTNAVPTHVRPIASVQPPVRVVVVPSMVFAGQVSPEVLLAAATIVGNTATAMSPGPPIAAPAHRLAFYLEHRAWRERKILDTLAGGPIGLPAIVAVAYDDTPADRHAPAARSALVHLLKLEAEGKVAQDAESLWSARGT